MSNESTTNATTKCNIDELINAMPQTFTPSLIDKLFKLNDGGKTIRRHLRKQFANDMNHNHNDKWSFDKIVNRNIIEYFASKYVADISILTTTK